jgi:hypothetical protein
MKKSKNVDDDRIDDDNDVIDDVIDECDDDDLISDEVTTSASMSGDNFNNIYKQIFCTKK